jgi:hypothetical protein
MSFAPKSRFVLAIIAGMFGAAVRSADAGDLSVYSDLGSFEGATTGLTDVNFNGLVAPGAFEDFAIPTGYTDSTTGTNFTFLDASGDDINITSATYSGSNFPGDTLNPSSDISAGASELITLPTSSTAIGLYFSTYSQAPLTFALSNGDTYTDSMTPAYGNMAFVGLTDTTPFTSLTIGNGSDVLLVGFYYGSASVPEPNSAILLGVGGLVGMLALVVTKRRALEA